MRRPTMLDLLELFGVACLAVFASFIWLPACLLVVGVAAIFVAWTASKVPPTPGDGS
jgi:uncharacterized membrane protein